MSSDEIAAALAIIHNYQELQEALQARTDFMEAVNVIGAVKSYGELQEALRERAEHLHVSRQALDDIAGLQSGYCAKLLAPVPVKKMGRMSLGAILGAMGLRLVLVEDHAALARVKSRLKSAMSERGGLRMPTRKGLPGHNIWKNNSHWGKALTVRRLAKMTAKDRSDAASHAAFYRWNIRPGRKRRVKS